MSAWMDATDVTLPGPAEFWPNDYDYERYGFDVPLNSQGYKEAFDLIWAEERSLLYDLVFPSDSDLRLMSDSPEARLIQKMMLHRN
jgi:hypothetical protein